MTPSCSPTSSTASPTPLYPRFINEKERCSVFIIKCTNCGREQYWSDGVTVGQGTVIEVADRAVYCECGAVVEEENGELFNLL